VTGWQQVTLIGILAAWSATTFWAWMWERRAWHNHHDDQGDDPGEQEATP
jgi:hypothetical protein